MAASTELNCKKDVELLKEAQNSAWERVQFDRRLQQPKSLQTISPHEVAMELLTKDWISTDHDLATKLYLAEKVLPVLVLSLEQLLMNVTRKGLEEQEGFRDDFNPVNFVAEFLMRHNPHYPHPHIASSSLYYGGLKEVASELKRRVLGKEGNSIEEIKKKLQEKRESEKAVRQAKIEEEARRKGLLAETGHIWNIDDKIPAQQVQQVVSVWLDSGDGKQFVDKFENFFNLDDINNETSWNEEELVHIMHPLCLNLPEENFTQLIEYLKECGKERQRSLLKLKRKTIFEKVFTQCDSANYNAINRQHIMSLFTIFYDKANDKIKDQLTDPRTWPASGQEEDEATDEEWLKEGSTVSDIDYQDFMTSPNHIPTEIETIDNTTLPSVKSESHTCTTTETLSTFEFEGFVERLATKQLATPVRTVLPEGPGEQWNPEHLDLSQFLQLCDLLLGDNSKIDVAEMLSGFLIRNYLGDGDSDELGSYSPLNSAILRMKKSHKINEIFTLWDNNCSGYLQADEIIALLGQWKNFGTEEGKKQIEAGFERFGVIGRQVSKIQFTALADVLTCDMTSNEFKEFADLIMNSIKLTQEQEKRGLFRQQILCKIKKAGYSTTGQIIPSLEAAVKGIQKDSVVYGGNKKSSVAIGILERSNDVLYLNYKAASDDAVYHVIGKKLNQTQAPVSFNVVKTGIPVHIPNVHKHGRVHFFIPEHSQEDEYQGSLVVAPIDSNGTVVGTISIDFTLPINKPSNYFSDHEIAFYRGVGVTLGEVYQASVARRKLLGAAEAGIMWLLRRCSAIQQIDFYLIRFESEEANDKEYSLQLALHADQSLNEKIVQRSEMLKKSNNSFKEYLFQCVETSETVTAEVYCHHHLSCPLRDTEGHTVAVLDLTLNQKINSLSPQHTRDINKMVKLLMASFHQSSSTSGNQESVMVLFYQLLLADLQSCMTKLDKRAFAELRSYNEPPAIIENIIQVLLMIIYPDIECDTWTKCKPWINIDLLNLMEEYKPDIEVTHSKLKQILDVLRGISPKEVFRHGSLPAKYMYTWVSACGAVLEHGAHSNSSV